MEDYPSNSYNSKKNNQAEKPKVEKVITGTARTKQKSELRKFADDFVAEDLANVRIYIWKDVLVPSFKKAVSDIVTNGIDMLLYGEAGRSKHSSNASKVSYGSYYESGKRASSERRVSNGFDYDEIVFETRGQAEAVIDGMEDILRRYPVVTVGDLYDLAGVTTHNYMVNKYGWTDIRIAEAIRVRDGYIIKMPKPMPID